MSGFPRLVPAFTAQVPLNPGVQIGTARNGDLFMASFVEGEGSLRSEPGYEVQFDGVFAHGSDYIRPDADGRYARLDVNSLLRDSKSGALLRYGYTGNLALIDPIKLVLGDKPEAKSTDFGHVFTNITFESSDAALKALNDKVYVGSGRFIVEQGKPVLVEYKISEVTY
ncbi:hypothetical protein GGTG_06052 [Gaeumannomyces tritici R3-111a-1]|uniref:Uncharacterized protein n=1 Tax=Gaeumannomyces tritici (strain R3-111a-1) TaxID=644352 RepID=J3NXP6_GAET3|nr:hypothetical protein GGTG_06052 [Gaeumannomyces tritici R3-111a-1]EJT76129.1 hypothetical protein GGTG_06052 [Gaeumannomyces tritici R3-111a-1]